jgi:hypothetical protein
LLRSRCAAKTNTPHQVRSAAELLPLHARTLLLYASRSPPAARVAKTCKL